VFVLTEAGAVMTGCRGAGLIATVAESVALHAPAVIVTPRSTDPEGPAEKVISGVPWPLWMAPPAIVQRYVAPGCSLTVAKWLAVPPQTDGGAAITAIGAATVVTVCESVAVHPLPLLTVTEYTVVDSGETVMVCVVSPPGDQRYEVAPGPASSVTGLPAQVVDGPLIDAAGRALTVTFTGGDGVPQPAALKTVTE
jgi:hypothetical protein